MLWIDRRNLAKRPFKSLVVGMLLHDGDNGAEMEQQFRYADFQTEPLVQLVARGSPFSATFFKLCEQPRRYPSVDKIVRQMPEVLRQFHIWSEFNPAQTAKVFEIICGKCLYPASQRFGQELFKLFFKITARPVILKSSRLINQSNDSDLGESANKGFASVGDMNLLVMQLALLSRFQYRITDVRQYGGFVTISTATVCRLKDDWILDHIGQALGNKRSKGSGCHKLCNPITAPTSSRSLAHIERIHDSALDEDTALVLKDVTGNLPLPDDQGVSRVAVSGLRQLLQLLALGSVLPLRFNCLHSYFPASFRGEGLRSGDAAFGSPFGVLDLHALLLAYCNNVRFYLHYGEKQVEFEGFKGVSQMSESILSAPYFHSEVAAYEFVEARLWTRGPVCPHCGVIGNSAKLKGKSTRVGVHKCRDCRKPFRVTVGTIFEASHIPLNVWLQAVFLIASSKKGMSSNQLHRSLGISLKSAWFMSHRIREAMRDGNFVPFGVGGGVVEVAETYIGHDKTIKPKGEKRGRGFHHKNKILSLVDRNSGQARSFVVDDVKAKTLAPIIRENLAREAKLMTDDHGVYSYIGREFAAHYAVMHQRGEYVNRLNPEIHTNTIEGFFSVFKRGMKGVYQHCAHNHLHRYLAEFDFRYNNRKALGIEDAERADKLLKGVVGKRLTYQTTA